MTNPFEQADGLYHVLINEEGQHSLWPAYIAVPTGWDIVCQSESRESCLSYINANWQDMRPGSLRILM